MWSNTGELRLKPELAISLEHSATVITPGKHKITHKGTKSYNPDGTIERKEAHLVQTADTATHEQHRRKSSLLQVDSRMESSPVNSVSTADPSSARSTPYGHHSRNNSLFDAIPEEQSPVKRLVALHESLARSAASSAVDESSTADDVPSEANGTDDAVEQQPPQSEQTALTAAAVMKFLSRSPSVSKPGAPTVTNTVTEVVQSSSSPSKPSSTTDKAVPSSAKIKAKTASPKKQVHESVGTRSRPPTQSKGLLRTLAGYLCCACRARAAHDVFSDSSAAGSDADQAHSLKKTTLTNLPFAQPPSTHRSQHQKSKALQNSLGPKAGGNLAVLYGLDDALDKAQNEDEHAAIRVMSPMTTSRSSVASPLPSHSVSASKQQQQQQPAQTYASNSSTASVSTSLATPTPVSVQLKNEPKQDISRNEPTESRPASATDPRGHSVESDAEVSPGRQSAGRKQSTNASLNAEREDSARNEARMAHLKRVGLVSKGGKF